MMMNSYRLFFMWSFGYFVLLIAVLGVSSCHKEIKSPKNNFSKIVFLSNRDAPKRHFDIFIMNLDGSGQTNLTRGRAEVRSISSPQISPDGSEILFLAFEAGKKILKKMKVDGSELLNLAEINTDNPHARYSPDGKKIVFADRINTSHQIYIMNNNGGSKVNLSKNSYDEKEPIFSPDGNKIAFVSRQTGTYSLCIMNIDGSNKKRLTDNSADDQSPQFSLDGKTIVFCSGRDGNNDIFLINQDGSQQKNIFTNNAYNSQPKFSADGTKVSFLSNVRGNRYRDILLLDLLTRKTINLTDDFNFINQNHIFSIDGQSLIFESIKFGDSEICAIDITGENLRNLSNHPRWDCAPTN